MKLHCPSACHTPAKGIKCVPGLITTVPDEWRYQENFQGYMQNHWAPNAHLVLSSRVFLEMYLNFVYMYFKIVCARHIAKKCKTQSTMSRLCRNAFEKCLRRDTKNSLTWHALTSSDNSTRGNLLWLVRWKKFKEPWAVCGLWGKLTKWNPPTDWAFLLLISKGIFRNRRSE